MSSTELRRGEKDGRAVMSGKDLTGEVDTQGKKRR